MFFVGCSMNVGPHVNTRHVDVTKYVCNYSDGLWTQDRTIALCDTQQECNDICAKLVTK